MRVQTLARHRHRVEALDQMRLFATNGFGGFSDCVSAGCLAVGIGDSGAYRQLCGLILARHAASQEGYGAAELVKLLLAQPQNQSVLRVAEELVARVASAKDHAVVLAPGLRGCLEYRRGQYVEALKSFRLEQGPLSIVFVRQAETKREFAMHPRFSLRI